MPYISRWVGVHPGDDRHFGEQPQERAVELVGFGHHQVAPVGRKQQIGLIIPGDASHKGKAVDMRLLQQIGSHRGNRCFSVGTRYRDATSAMAQGTQHFRAFDEGKTVGTKPDHLVKTFGYSRGKNNQG